MPMLPTFLTLFIAGLLTILLPCILPLLPIVLGVSVSGRHPLRPLATIGGMLTSFVLFTMLLLTILSEFVLLADLIRVSTYYILLLFGAGFLTEKRPLQFLISILGGFFYLPWGAIAVLIAAIIGVIAMELGGRIASRLQQIGSDVQGKARNAFGGESLLTAFIIGLTLGLIWVPCAGPALGFAFTLVREHPGLEAAALLGSYGLGTAIPLLLVGYGGQYATHSVRALSRFSGTIKRVAGLLLILSAVGLQFRTFEKLQIFLLEHTNFGDLGTRLEERFVPSDMFDAILNPNPNPLAPRSSERSEVGNPSPMPLPRLIRAPEFQKLGPWHNAEPFTLADIKGKVVLVDFWTYSCINCIRTLPYIQGYWEKFGALKKANGESAFVLLGVHSPEFVFEKSEENVADAIKRHGLTYPTAQDNLFGTWRAFANRYWPAKYLIDAEGYIRYTHFGEGGYEETESAIASLLQEIGVEGSKEGKESIEGTGRRNLTPETYLGERSWPALGNGSLVPTDEETLYKAPEALELHKYYLVGEWQMIDRERQVLLSAEGEIRMKFLGGEINLVLGLEEGTKNIEAEVEVDGELVKEILIDKDDLFHLFTGEYGEHELILRIHGKGVAGYAFTFGS